MLILKGIYVVFKKNGKPVYSEDSHVYKQSDTFKFNFNTEYDVDDYDVYFSLYSIYDDNDKVSEYNNEDLLALKDKLGTLEECKDYISDDGLIKVRLERATDPGYSTDYLLSIENIGNIVVDTDIFINDDYISVDGLRHGDVVHRASTIREDDLDSSLNGLMLLGFNNKIVDLRKVDGDNQYNIVDIPDENKELVQDDSLADDEQVVYKFKDYNADYKYIVYLTSEKPDSIYSTDL